jgi:hypothetical protein
VPDCNSNSAIIAVFAKDVKALGLFTIGVCYSTSSEPTIEDSHVEIEVNSDTLIIDNMTLDFDLTGLAKGTGYFVKGYVKSVNDTYYSAEEEFTTPFNTLNIDVSDDYIPDGQEYWIVLSNNSNTILTQKIENNRSYTFSDDIPDLADIHIFKLNQINTRYYLTVESYADIVPDDFDLDYPYTTTPNAGQVTVSVPDMANFLRWGISGTFYSSSTTNATSKSLTTSLGRDPDNLFIHYIPSNGTAPRYKYITNISPSSTYTYAMADFAAMTNYSDIILPVNNYFYYYMGGYNTDYYADNMRYYYHTYGSGYSGTFRLYYPSAILSKYYFASYYINSTQQSYIYKVGSLPTVYFTQFPNMTLNNTTSFTSVTTDISNYSEYEVLNIYGYLSNSTVYVSWNYYKQPQASNSFAVPDIPSQIKDKIGDLAPSDLSFSIIGYFDILGSQVTSYADYVDQLVKKSSRFYDVIKERRIYALTAGNKSTGNMADHYNEF